MKLCFAKKCPTYRHEIVAASLVLAAVSMLAAQEGKTFSYNNRLTPIEDAKPLLADYPEYIHPIIELRRLEAPRLVNDDDANLDVRAWRFSYNARAIIEMPNRLRGEQTALIMVHPWGIDDGQGWWTPEPAGVADFCTPEKNHLAAQHIRDVVDPFLKRLRPHVGFVMYSLPKHEQPVHAKLYRSIRKRPTDAERKEGAEEIEKILNAFDYQAEPLPAKLELSRDLPVVDYFNQFRGLDSGDRFNGAGYWDLPIPIIRDVTVDPDDIVIYDAEGYESLRDYLKGQGVRHVLLTGYCADMCFRATTAGYLNLRNDFNVFLVGDATLATFPANATPKYATNAHMSFASLDQLITQVSWVREVSDRSPGE